MSGKDGERNVLVLATTFPKWEDGSTPKFVYELSKELDRHANKVVVLSPHDQGSAFHEEMGGLEVYRYPYFFPIRYQTLRTGSTVDKVQSSHLAKIQIPFLILSLFAHTLWLIRKEEIDVIQSHWILPNGVVGSIMNHLMGIRHVMTIHAGGALMLQKIPFNRRIATYTYRHSEAILPVSSHISRTYLDLVDEDAKSETKSVVVQPMGTHTSDFTGFDEIEDGGNDHVVGLYVGRLAEKKGVNYLLDAVAILDDTEQDFELTIVGTGSLGEELRAKAAELGVEDVVEFTGWVSDEELNRHYVDADFVVVPSVRTAAGDTEGMPTVISEAMAAGNPVIATNAGGITDVVEDGANGYIIEQRQPSEIADRMSRLISDPSLRQRLSDGALETAEGLDWSQCGETYWRFLQPPHSLPGET